MNELIWYGRFERVMDKPNGEPYKQPKYTCVAEWGKYSPMESLKGRDGKISVSLLESTQSGSKNETSTPPMKLQAKNSLNLTGLKDYFVGGKLSGYAYGNPHVKPTYGADNKKNPFGEGCSDGFLFRFNFEEGSNVPTGFEMIVVPNVGNLIVKYCKPLQMGGFNSFLEEVNRQLVKNG